MDAEIKIQRFSDWPEATAPGIPPAAPVTALTLFLSPFPPPVPSLLSVELGGELAQATSPAGQ